ncbi:MAG: TRAP transporter substrate-binding protein DctP [Clostridia bacterium]|jgi:TRAP-type C4-dicarboxylate transport system substrate-binding protein|nr:TRAP transporter substrate-binding protein DctP [Clostridia bacterium]
MRKRSKLISIFLIAIMSLTLIAGCGGGGGGEAEDKVTIRVAAQDPEGHPNIDALNEIKAKVEEETNGRIEMKIYPANQLGDYSQVYEEVMKGSIEMALITIPTQYDARFEMMAMPYLATNYDQAKKTFLPDSVFGQEWGKFHEGLGVKFLGFSMTGGVGITTTKPLKNVEEPLKDKGVMIRIPQMEIWKHTMADMGFRNVGIPYAELYTSLQTGIVDGSIGTSPLDTYSTVRDVVKYYYLYNVFYDNMSYIMNKDLFDSLKPEEQQLFVDLCREYNIKSIERAEATDEEYLKKLHDEKGVEIVEIPQEALDAFAKQIRENTWNKMEERLTSDLLNKLKASVGL